MSSNFFDRPFREASAANGFAGNIVDRQSEHRAEDAVEAALRAPDAQIYLFCDDRALVAVGATPRAGLSLKDAEALGLERPSLVLLGFAGRSPRLAGLAPAREEWPEPLRAIDLRSLAVQGLLSAEDLGALAQARSLLAWHQNHRFCARCGSETEMRAGGVKRHCPSCEREHFPRTDPVVIMLVIDPAQGNEACLLGRQHRFQPGMYSALAGFLEPGETIEAAVRREIAEEAGIRTGRVRYHSSQPWPFVSSLMIGCHAEAASNDITRDESELEDCRWFARDEVRRMLAGTHPDGLTAPPEMAIAHRLIADWADWAEAK
ncbi:NAD(+) diphosphatase [Afifella marina]|uniref:NAD(+) diphosphatase n=1 Tax=Afifella marina DSM 2698 TaxID=1120955 RepID=A0A1G5NBN4_AFIMA|nr:NAD(+) diphosphatase [Afifella marina]MBK1623143.1 NADH pyrophosphatase [Afifella marina DSM 2698]MBK1626137.1 NADH pyrophosphatase [Afifella marina]MBK5917015.1 NADH pyrophosphatase [Afifella marina]RAI22015.1 NADH pyrophosphatase [Afifella marina DSM 2698]SCZ34348.1 NAD+ diphosphatase [Afifella marina DSM 2698]